VDNSKLPKMTNKSSESPWEPSDKSRSHERKRLSDRAGTVGSSVSQVFKTWPKLGGDRVRSWSPSEKDLVTNSTITEGKYQSGKYKGKPHTGRVFHRGKNKSEETEY
jgi:hypothetical protein